MGRLGIILAFLLAFVAARADAQQPGTIDLTIPASCTCTTATVTADCGSGGSCVNGRCLAPFGDATKTTCATDAVCNTGSGRVCGATYVQKVSGIALDPTVFSASVQGNIGVLGPGSLVALFGKNLVGNNGTVTQIGASGFGFNGVDVNAATANSFILKHSAGFAPTALGSFGRDDTAGTVVVGNGSTTDVFYPAHKLLDGAGTSDSVSGTVVRGDMVVGNSTPKWARVVAGAAGRFWRSDGTDPSWTDPTANDDFTQYAKLGGRTGSTNDLTLSTSTAGTLYGSSASGQNLNLKSTSHATKGAIELFDSADLVQGYTGGLGTSLNALHLGQAVSYASGTDSLYLLRDDHTTTLTGTASYGGATFYDHKVVNLSGNGGTSQIILSGGLDLVPTINLNVAPTNGFVTWTNVNAGAILSATTGITAGTQGNWINFNDAGRVSAIGTGTITVTNFAGYVSSPSITTNNASGSVTITERDDFQSNDTGYTATGTVHVVDTSGFTANNKVVGTSGNRTVDGVKGFWNKVTAGTGKWGFFDSAGANNSFKGPTRFGDNTVPTDPVEILQATSGSEAFKITTTETTSNPTYRVFQKRLTTAGTAASTFDIATTTDNGHFVEARVLARCTSGAGCTAGQTEVYTARAAVKNVSGTVTTTQETATLMGTLTSAAAANLTIVTSSTNARITCTGPAASANVTWEITAIVQDVGG